MPDDVVARLQRTLQAARRVENELREIERQLAGVLPSSTPVLTWAPRAPHPGSSAQQLERPSISRAQRRVLALLPAGLTRAQIGAELHLSPHTVKTHLRGIYRSLGVSTRDDAIAVARSYDYL